MKSLFLLSMFFTLSAAAAPTHTLEFNNYLFTGNLTEMTATLKDRLVAKIAKVCGEESEIDLLELNINFRLGGASSGATLRAKIIKDNGGDDLNFPSHPEATLAVTFACN